MFFIVGQPSSIYNSFCHYFDLQGVDFECLAFECYPDGEIGIKTPLKPIDCIIQCPLSSPHKTYVCALQLIQKLKPNIFCCPYTPYSQNSYLFKNLTQKCNHFVTLDLHNSLHHNPSVTNLYPTDLFIQEILKNYKKLKDLCVLAPDRGACIRAFKMAEKLHVPLFVACKTRGKEGTCSINLPSIPSSFKTCLIVDDLVSSGETLKAVLQNLKQKNISNIIVCISHTLFPPVESLLSEIRGWITTNTSNIPFHKKIHKISIEPFLVSYLKNKFMSSYKFSS